MSLSIFVLDPAGRPLRPISPRKAAGKVERGNARWLHAPGHDPDMTSGAIIMAHAVRPQPEDPERVQLFDADGVRLGALDAEYVARAGTQPSVEIDRIADYAVILRRRAPAALVQAIREAELRRAWRRLLDRDRVISETLRSVCEKGAEPWSALERQILNEMSPYPRRAALAEVRALRARWERLDLADLLQRACATS